MLRLLFVAIALATITAPTPLRAQEADRLARAATADEADPADRRARPAPRPGTRARREADAESAS